MKDEVDSSPMSGKNDHARKMLVKQHQIAHQSNEIQISLRHLNFTPMMTESFDVNVN